MARRKEVAPLTFILVPLLLAIAIAAGALVYALNQPWLGLQLAADGQNGVRIVGVSRNGPSSSLSPGARLVALADGQGNGIELTSLDANEDPDLAPTYEDFERFFERQDMIFTILAAEQVALELADGRIVTATPSSTRPLTSLPPAFWILIFTGLASMVVGGWTLGVKRDNDAIRLWALGGMALLLSTFPSAVFITRELALDGGHFRAMSTINNFGSLSFCALLLAIFLIYPRRLVPLWVVAGLLAAIPVWCVIEFFHIGLSGPEMGRYLPQAILVSAASVLAVVQFVLAREEPLKRAAVGWFGLSIAICSGIYIILYVTPSVLGRVPDVPQWISYALGLVVQTSLALGISRYRLFDVEPWAFRILFYVVGTAIFALLDIMLIAVASLDAMPAFGLALAAVVLFYLPLRNALLDRVMPERRQNLLFREVIDVALAANMAERDARWRGLLSHAFDPLEIAPASPVAAPCIADEGLALAVPGIGTVTPLRLRYAHAGRRLFSRRHLELARELCDVLAYATQSRNAYERGIQEERSRIARDMHDNIGARLLSALHSPDQVRRETMIREAMSELRGIINNAFGAAQSLEESLAELRLETSERLSEAGVDLDWTVSGDMASPLPPATAHAMRSIVREGVSNTLRHANATRIRISVALEDARLDIAISDNGKSSKNVPAENQGVGLMGIGTRLEKLNGSLQIQRAESGFHLKAALPILPGAAE